MKRSTATSERAAVRPERVARANTHRVRPCIRGARPEPILPAWSGWACRLSLHPGDEAIVRSEYGSADVLRGRGVDCAGDAGGQRCGSPALCDECPLAPSVLRQMLVLGHACHERAFRQLDSRTLLVGRRDSLEHQLMATRARGARELPHQDR
jgi:hypothetical protein